MKFAKVSSKMQPKVVVLLPFVVLKCNFIVAFESKVCQNPRMNTLEGKA